jgi:hypothetical protein
MLIDIIKKNIVKEKTVIFFKKKHYLSKNYLDSTV